MYFLLPVSKCSATFIFVKFVINFIFALTLLNLQYSFVVILRNVVDINFGICNNFGKKFWWLIQISNENPISLLITNLGLKLQKRSEIQLFKNVLFNLIELRFFQICCICWILCARLPWSPLKNELSDS